jgi:DNA-binding NarL/FixJ family response regulator
MQPWRPNLVGTNLMRIDKRNAPADSSSRLRSSGVSAQASYYLSEGTLDGQLYNDATNEKLATLLQDIETLLELAHREGASSSNSTQNAPMLTQRPREVLQLIHAGMTPMEIGKELHISVKTVRRHIEILKRVLDEPRCHYRRLPAKAREMGIL